MTEDFELLKKYNIPFAEFVLVKKIEEIPCNFLEFPVVLKANIKEHKTEKGGVKIVYCKENFEEEFNKMKENFEEIIVQKFIKGYEVLIGTKQDKTFGSIIVFGEGGFLTEFRKDLAFRIAPISKEEATEMIKEVKFYEVLKGFRGKKANLELLAEIITKVSELSFKEKVEMDINPFIINEKEGFAVDVRIFK